MNGCAYRYGWWAAAVGAAEHMNPFRPATTARESWREGHRDAMAHGVEPKLEPEVAIAIAAKGVGP